MRYTPDLRDAEWQLIQHCFPKPSKKGRPREHTYRERLNAMFYLVRTGCQRRIWPWVAMNSLAGQTLGVSCLQWALESTPTGIVMSIVALTPLTVMPLARIFEGEKITARALIGGAIAVAGVVMLTLSKWSSH